MPTADAPKTWEEFARALGIELQRHRIRAGMAQEELAHRAGLSRTHYQQLERGEWKPGKPANPSLRVFLRLCQVMNVPPNVVLPETASIEFPRN